MSHTTADRLISDLEERVPPAVYAARLHEFMLEGAELIRARLPDVAVDALDVARRYWVGNATESDLDSARERCWLYIRSLGSSTDLQTPAVCGARAIIMLLRPKSGDDDPLERAAFFIEMANKLEDHDEEYGLILKRLFREFLPD